MVVPESFQLDQEILLDAGAQLHRLKMYPYFDIAHYLLMIIEVRDDLGSASSIFSRKHPLSCWLSSMLMCFADAFLANFLLGEPVIAPFKRHDDVILATIVWYLVFYAPFDGIYKISKITPVKCVLAVMKEVKRAYKVSHGVSHAAKLYPQSYLVQILVGTAKGAGSGVVRTLEQLVRGVWLPTHNELLRPSFATKACVVAATVLALEKNGTYITAPHDLIYLVMDPKEMAQFSTAEDPSKYRKFPMEIQSLTGKYLSSCITLIDMDKDANDALPVVIPRAIQLQAYNFFAHIRKLGKNTSSESSS